MTTKPPPVPPASRSDKGPGEGPEDRAEDITRAGKAGALENPDKQGQTANTRINTTHQGMRQDR
jgi:hypothetical protein